MHAKYIVLLTETERSELEHLIAGGTAPARKLTHARILLKADRGPAGPGWGDARIAESVEVSPATIARVRRQWVEAGGGGPLHPRAPRPGEPREVGGAPRGRVVGAPGGGPPPGPGRAGLRGAGPQKGP